MCKNRQNSLSKHCGCCVCRLLQHQNTMQLAHTVHLCFVCFLRHKATVPLHGSNWLIFLTKSHRVLCKVQTETLHIISINAIQQVDREMAQAVSRRPFSTETCVRSDICPCEICGEKCGIGTGFPRVIQILPASVIISSLHNHLHLHVALRRRTKRRKTWSFKKQWYFENWKIIADRSIFTAFFLHETSSYLFAGLLLRRTVFDPGSVHVRFVVGIVTLAQVFLRIIRFPLASTTSQTFQAHLHRHASLTRGTKWQSLKTNAAMLLPILGTKRALFFRLERI
jgi:hypothetical protein